MQLCNMNRYWYFVNAMFSDVYIIVSNICVPQPHMTSRFTLEYTFPYDVMEYHIAKGGIAI